MVTFASSSFFYFPEISSFIIEESTTGDFKNAIMHEWVEQ